MEKSIWPQSAIINFLNTIEPYYIIAIIVVGLIGNTISFGIFIFTKLK